MTDPLEYYAQQGAALFPIPAGQKAPWGIVESFKDNASRDPEQWKKWRVEHPGCNFGVVAYASQWITADTDIKPSEGQSPEDARAEAWSMRAELLQSWGMDAATLPHVQSARGGWHDYFSVPEGIDAETLRQPDAIKKRINLRVVGYTVAAGGYYDGTAKGEESGHYQLFENAPPPHPAPAPLIEYCRRVDRAPTAAKIGSHDRGDVGNLVGWLNARDGFDAYEDWCSLGMALKLECGDDAKELWALSHNDTVTEDVIESKWESFASEATANSVTLASFMKRAHQLGWTGSIRPSVGSMFGGVAQIAPGSAPSIAPSFNMAGVPGPTNPVAEENEAAEMAHPTPPGGFIKTSAEFLADYEIPDYVVDDIFERRYCYSLTAQTGTGKTAVAMLIAAHVAEGRNIGAIECDKGDVIYFAGENPSDVQKRWMGLTQEMNLKPENVRVHFICGAMHISKVADRIRQEIIDKNITPVLIIVDTAAAYFEEDNDNDNVQAGNHARRMRSLCTLPNTPCVIVLCHPTKNAQDGDLVPRGGGAFLNEVDGNIALRKNESLLAMQWLGKFRGSDFDTVHFELKAVSHPRLIDKKGRQKLTVVARPVSNAEVGRREEKLSQDENKVLEILCNSPGLKVADIARTAEHKHNEQTSRLLKRLADEKLAKAVNKRWVPTPDGQKYLNMAATATAAPVQALKPLTPDNLGGAAFPTPKRPGTAPPMPPR